MTSSLFSFLIFAAVALAQLPPWEEPTMYFSWPHYNASITQCRPLQLRWWQIPSKKPDIQPPFTWTWYQSGYEPYALDVGAGTLNKFTKPQSLSFDWTVDLPVGGPYQVIVTDAVGANGGVADNLYVNAPTQGSDCTPIALNQSSLSYSISPGMAECQTLDFQVYNGTPPYTLTVIPGWMFPKKITYAAANWTYVLDIPVWTNVNFAIQDTQGKAVVSDQFQVGANDTNCLNQSATLLPQSPGLQTTWPGGLPDMAPTSTSSSAAPSGTTESTSSNSADRRIHLAGGISVGLAVLLLCILGYAVWGYYRSRRFHVVDLGDPLEFYNFFAGRSADSTLYDPSYYPARSSRSSGPEDRLLHQGDSSFGSRVSGGFNPYTTSLYTDRNSSSNQMASRTTLLTGPYAGHPGTPNGSSHQLLPPGARPPSPTSSAGAYQPSYSTASVASEKALPPKPVDLASPPLPRYSPLLPGRPATGKIHR